MKSTVRALKLDQSPWVVLYAVTLAGQWFAAVARWLLAYIALELVKLLTGWPIPSNPIALAFAFAPLVVSLLAVLCPPLDGRWWEISSGGRPPEQDEREAFDPHSANSKTSTRTCAHRGTGSSPKHPAQTPPPTPPRCKSNAGCWKAPMPLR